MNHHPHALCTYSVASLITGQVGHFWKADPGHFSKAPKVLQEMDRDNDSGDIDNQLNLFDL
jgi:hypothetical protein